MSDPRLAEARKREAEAEVVATRDWAGIAPADYDRLLRARRATDEALIAAARQWFVDENNLEGEVGPSNAASLLDALEEGVTTRTGRRSLALLSGAARGGWHAF